MSHGEFAVVTGAASGIGLVTAEILARSGPVLALDRSADALEKAAGRIGAAGAEVLTSVTDVADEAQVADAFSRLPEGARVRALVNSAGIFEHHPAETMPTRAWRDVVSVNLDGTFFCCRAAFPYLGHGSVIVNVGSLNAHMALPERVNYAASKAAVLMLTRCLAVEWAARGIRVVSVSPGIIDTPMNRRVMSRGSDDADRMLQRIPLGRIGEAAEVARVIEFLVSNGASYLTGCDVQVDGGIVTYGAV